MGDHVDVGDIELLVQLRAGLVAFSEESERSLELTRVRCQIATLEVQGIHDRWAKRVRELEPHFTAASQALRGCQSRTVTDQQGRTYSPPCTAELEAYKRIGRLIRRAQENVEVSRLRLRTIEVAFSQFAPEARALKQLTGTDLVHACAWLDQRVAALRAFRGAGGPAGSSSPLREPPYEEPPRDDATAGDDGPTHVKGEQGPRFGEDEPRPWSNEGHVGHPERG